MRKPLRIVILLSFCSVLNFSSGYSFGKNNDLVSNTSTPGNCLEKYYGNPEVLLTLELVGRFVDFKGAEAEVEKVSEQIIRDKDFTLNIILVRKRKKKN